MEIKLALRDKSVSVPAIGPEGDDESVDSSADKLYFFGA
jgi:hypothetical protein